MADRLSHDDRLPLLAYLCSEPLPMTDSAAQQIDPDIETKRAEAAKMAWGGSNAGSSMSAPPSAPLKVGCDP